MSGNDIKLAVRVLFAVSVVLIIVMRYDDVPFPIALGSTLALWLVTGACVELDDRFRQRSEGSDD